MNKKVLAGLGLLDESEISESWNVFIRIACECKCQKCGKIHRFLDDIEYDKELFSGYSYKDFRKLCDTSDLSFEDSIMKNITYICDACSGDAKIVDIADIRIYFE